MRIKTIIIPLRMIVHECTCSSWTFSFSTEQSNEGKNNGARTRVAWRRRKHGQAVRLHGTHYRHLYSWIWCSTARKVHAEYFKKAIADIRKQYLRDFQSRQNGEGPELGSDSIHVYVRKRPLLPHELQKHEFDVISAIGKREIVIHECKMYNDMRHKYVVSHHQRFSRCYDENTETEQVYLETTKPLVLHAMEGGKSVCMMYGQTGSGKTYTMGGMLHNIAEDLFQEAVGTIDFSVSVRAVEITGSNCFGVYLGALGSYG